MRRIAIVTGGLFVGALLWSGESLARRGPLSPETGETTQSAEANEARGLFATGLSAVFPEAAECPGIASPHGSPTRYDGSPRKNDHGGIHNGLDITLPAGTPLLSAADGEVIHAGTAGRLVGNFIWLRYAPEATGLPVHVFARYQHLDDRRRSSRASVSPGGSRSDCRATPAPPAATTANRAIRTCTSTSGSRRARTSTRTGRWWPRPTTPSSTRSGVYLGAAAAPFDNHVLRALPAEKKQVAVPVATGDGRLMPEGARVSWPVACRSR